MVVDHIGHELGISILHLAPLDYFPRIFFWVDFVWLRSFIRKQPDESSIQLVAPDRQKHGEGVPATTGPPGSFPTASPAQARRDKLRTPQGRATYKMRKATVEPVFAQIKEQRGLRRFLLGGRKQVEGEWQLICATHNLLKLYRCGWKPQRA